MEKPIETLELRLSDEVIGHVCQMIQLSLLTGTDVVDRMRLMGLELDEKTSKLTLSPAYSERAVAEVDALSNKADELSKKAAEQMKEKG